jgi:hypothetical protein
LTLGLFCYIIVLNKVQEKEEVMDIGCVIIICITAIVIALMVAGCYLEHIRFEVEKIRANAAPHQKNLDNVPYTYDNIWKKK